MAKSSSAALSIVAGVRVYAEPPATLSEAAAVVWRKTIRSKPVEWFGDDSYPMLALYCRAVVEESKAGAALHAIDVASLSNDELIGYGRLVRIVDAQRRAIAMLATKMRLCQQSKYGHRQAAEGKGRPQSMAAKPWERAS